MCNYWHYSIYISAFYMVSIFMLKHWMRDREKYDLRRPLFAWSLGLCLFSCMGVSGLTVPHVQLALENGFYYSACHRVELDVVNVWMFLFALSKLPELADTYFIILRKQKLIFLHWYHHITVFIYCWLQYCQLYPPGLWFSAMNFFVHAIMYGYYAVRASGLYRPPIWVNMFITVLQLLQMLVGILITFYFYYHMDNLPWESDGYNMLLQVYLTLAMYFSYLILFANFFYTTYYCKSSPPKVEPKNITSSQREPPAINGTIPSFSNKSNGIRSSGLSLDSVRHR